MAEAKPLIRIEDYEPLIGARALERILDKARAVRDLHIVNVNATLYGGGVAELLSSLTLLMNTCGVRAGWRVIQGRPDFFSITKKMHNALQGAPINLSELKMSIYEEVLRENAARTHLDHDLVVVHDPQPLAMIDSYRRKSPWIWRCHVELSRPDPALWAYLKGFVERYDVAIVSMPEYRQDLSIPQRVFAPAIDPFSAKNCRLDEETIRDRLACYGIPDDLPLVVQISRFDRWKDPQGVIEAFRIARREVPCTLVLLGNVATDDPEGQEVFEQVLACRDERIIVLSAPDSSLVNALQRRAAVVLQKSLREGFGLTVAEAMWKGTPVVGGKTGGIRAQIRDGENGFLVTTVEEAACRIVALLKDEGLRRRMGERAHESVRERFLLSRLLEEYLTLFDGLEAKFLLRRPA